MPSRSQGRGAAADVDVDVDVTSAITRAFCTLSTVILSPKADSTCVMSGSYGQVDGLMGVGGSAVSPG